MSHLGYGSVVGGNQIGSWAKGCRMSLEARPQALHLLGGFMITQAMGVAARLGIADLVAERPRTVAELAAETGVNADRLARVVRALASVGVFTTEEGLVQTTAVGDLLCSNATGSLRALATSFSGEHYRAWTDAFETVLTGEPAFPRVFGSPYFDWLAEHPREAGVFNRAMAAGSGLRRATLVERDWAAVETVVDVGGGTGSLLTAVLVAHPHLRGVVVDLPHVRDGALATIAQAGLEARCTFVEESFFERVPEDADVYILSHILHDWDDEQATAILRVCRAAVRPASRLLIVDAVLRPGDEPDWVKVIDLHMLVMLGGRERSESEWRALLADGGFALDRVVLSGPGTIVEATPGELGRLPSTGSSDRKG